MGSHHDAANAGGGAAYPYSYGYRAVGLSGQESRSTMAYDPGTRIQYFSNPEVFFDGVPFGTSSANNALSLNNTAPTVAAFRGVAPIVCTKVAPSIIVSPAIQNGAAGEQKSYSVLVTNKDSGPCPAANFSFGLSIPSGWAGALNSQSASLAPGASLTTSFSVTSNLTSVGGDYILDFLSSESGISAHTASASARYLIDAVGPTVPLSLVASIPRGKRKGISLTWKALSDNVGVAGYIIYRNSSELQRLSGISFADSRVVTGQSYSYFIRAYDASGNISAASNIAIITAR